MRAENVPAELLHKQFSGWFASHGGSHAIPLSRVLCTAFIRSAKYSVSNFLQSPVTLLLKHLQLTGPSRLSMPFRCIALLSWIRTVDEPVSECVSFRGRESDIKSESEVRVRVRMRLRVSVRGSERACE